MLRTEEIKRQVNEWFEAGFEKHEAFSESAGYIRDLIDEWLEDLGSYDLEELLHEYNDDFHVMDDLDDVYEYMSVTEILRELIDIDPDDAYFNSCSNTSGNDIWSISDVSKNQLVRDLQRGEFYWNDRELDEILDLEPTFKSLIEEKWGVYEKAKALFEQQMREDPHAVLTALWNLNMTE